MQASTRTSGFSSSCTRSSGAQPSAGQNSVSWLLLKTRISYSQESQWSKRDVDCDGWSMQCLGSNPHVLGHGNNGLEEAPTICLVPLDDEGRSIHLGDSRIANSNSGKPNAQWHCLWHFSNNGKGNSQVG